MHDRGRPDDDDDEDVGSAARQIVHRWLDELKAYARTRPVESLLAAFVLGMLVVLLGRKDR